MKYLLIIWFLNGGVDHVEMPDKKTCQMVKAEMFLAMDKHSETRNNQLFTICVPASKH